MSFRAKNHAIKTYGSAKKAKPTSPDHVTSSELHEHSQLEHALNERHQLVSYVDRTLKWILPLAAFLLSVMTANFNWQSTLGTFIIALVSFYAVGIWRQNILIWVAVCSIYVLIDNYFSYSTLNIDKLPLHLGSLLIFLAMIHVGRPQLDKWLIYSKKKQQEKQNKL